MLTLYHSPQSRSDTVVHLVRMLGADADIREVTIRRQDGSGAPMATSVCVSAGRSCST